MGRGPEDVSGRGESAPAALKRYFLATSVSAFPFLEQIAAEAARMRPGITLTVGPIRNRFFGESVTVAGLVTARDTIALPCGMR